MKYSEFFFKIKPNAKRRVKFEIIYELLIVENKCVPFD